ncbi:type II toxin-antitoxin system VapC family toxin [Thalassospira sp.]|uniref:type II toxin-antitoxin system VapC family toxin n=1 Tax=Thalassospira sp. TaxID=1912094 RepID=UPI002735D883|nr:type II toxin-antitoxin system VapC family toxin [Thalassospira sp.]MDP2698746.1 type II toxin-antitoxin system VapC family toxin [Thalassospira sp.]
MSDTGDIVIIDTSAVIAILKREPEADNLIERIARNQPQMSAGTLAELLIVDE